MLINLTVKIISQCKRILNHYGAYTQHTSAIHIVCYRLNVCVPTIPTPNSYADALTPSVMVFGGGACGSN